jgi:hypothetical protein
MVLLALEIDTAFTILSGQGRVASAKCVGWGSTDEVTLLYLTHYPSALMYSMQIQGTESFLIMPLTRISIDVADSSLLPLLFLRSLSIL